MIALVLGIIMSYIIGSIPSGYMVGKLVKNIDIRSCGSGNVGATNVFRSVGKIWGIIVLVIDILKGLIVVIGIAPICQSDIFNIKYIQFLYGIAAICGHNWTIFLRFKGGKGVATTCGVILGIFPKALGICFVLFVLIVAITRYVSLGSIISAVLFPCFLWLFYRSLDGFPVFMVLSLIMVAFIVYRHRSNIQRLLKGEENKIKF